MLWRMTNKAMKPAAAAVEPSRRTVLRHALAGGISMAALMGPRAAQAAVGGGTIAFKHGVASGDPTPSNVIIWTALTPSSPGRYAVTWEVALSADMHDIVTSGIFQTDDSRDYTVKVDVGDLQPDTTYYFRFRTKGVTSVVGRTRTAPLADTPVDELKFAAFTCSNYEWGYFNAYDHAAKREDLNAILFLGDFIYEYAPREYSTVAVQVGAVAQPRASQLQPTADIVLLSDYRLRYRIYRTDLGLQRVSRLNPAIHIWDDHEFADNANRLGAFNHHPATQGTWSARKKAAIQAFYEWIPIREPSGGARYDDNGNPAPIYRSFDFGQLLRLVMLDTRIIGRDPSFEAPSETAAPQLYAVYSAPGADYSFPLDTANADGVGPKRTLLGATQEAWVDDQLSSSPQTWQLIGNQVLYRFGVAPDITLLPNTPPSYEQAATAQLLTQIFGTQAAAQFQALGKAGFPSPAEQDDWTGYPSAKIRFLASLAKARNPVIVTGDSHNSWASNIGALNGDPVAVEFGTTSVTSPGFEQTIVTVNPADAASLYVKSSAKAAFFHDRLVYADLSRRGYIVLDVTRARIQADFTFVSTVFAPVYTKSVSSWQVFAGEKQIKPV